MVSIIIPIRFRGDLTQVCIDSVLLYTKDFELILVQEGEDESIKRLLLSVVSGSSNRKYIQNKEPKGFAGAMNTGIDLAEGDYYCFLNNDTVVTPFWLAEMLKAFEDKDIGLVSPTFGETPSIQRVGCNDGHRFHYICEPLSLMGVCFLIKKETMDKIGKWDESFGLGGGDDNDICIRVLRAGYKMVIARKSYIYHYGSASFRELFNNDAVACNKSAVKAFKKFKEKYPDIKIDDKKLNTHYLYKG